MTGIIFNEGSTPSAPAANWLKLFLSSSLSSMMVENSAGALRVLGAPAIGAYRLGDINVVTTTGAGTYTPHTRAVALLIECIGGGGGGGAVNTGSVVAEAGGGGGGAYSMKWLTTNIQGTLTIAVGAGGPAGTAGGSNGTAGGDTSFKDNTAATVCLAKGGGGGFNMNSVAALQISSVTQAVGGAAASGVGDLTLGGGNPTAGFSVAATQVRGSRGGAGFKSMPFGIVRINQGAGIAGKVYGNGADGAVLSNTGASANGAAGGQGAIIVWEFWK